MEFLKSNKYDKSLINENMMGPNSIKMLEELMQSVKLEKGMRVLDLGCGKGLTSIFLAKEYGVQVFATDLWITATQNYELFKSFGLENQIIPIHADALELPYPDEYFDAVISIDAYYFFGRDSQYMDEKLAPLIKKGGIIALAFPGSKEEFNNSIPKEMLISWSAEDLETFHSLKWWDEILSRSEKIKIHSIQEMQCCEETWNDWLSCENEYAIRDRPSMEAGAGKYMNLLSVIAQRI